MTLALIISDQVYSLAPFAFYTTLGALVGWFSAKRRFRR